MNFKNSKKVIIAAAISTSVLFASNQAYASEAPDENSKEILDAVKDDSVDDAIKETIKEIDQLETTQQAPQSDPTDEQNLEEQTEDKEKSLSDNNEELKDFTLDNGGEIPLADTSDADDSDIDTIDEEFGNLASVDDLDPVNDLAPVEDDLDGLEPLGEDSEPVNGNTGANPIEDDFEDVPPIPDEDPDGEETETEELPVDEEEPPIPNEDPDPIDETTENLSGKTTIELETELIGIDNQKIDIESLPEEVEIEFTYGGKTQTKTIKREELYGLVELTNFDFKDEEDLKQKLSGRLDIGDGEKLDLTFTYDPNAIKQDENNKTIARVPLKIHQLFNPHLEVEFKDPDGYTYDNKDEIPIFVRWGENGSEYTSTLTTNPGVDEYKFSNGSGLVFDDNKYVEERSKTPTIIVRDDVAGDQVLTPDTKSFIYNGKTYNIKGINIDPIIGAKITPSAIANGEREIDGGRRVEDILFEIERSENENLPTGEVKIIQEGKKGKRVYQEYQPTLDGDDYGNPVEREVESEYVAPTNEKYQVGTGILKTSESSEDKEIPFTTITIEDKYLPSTYREVEREGKKGSKTVTTTSQTLNGNPYGEVVVTEKINILPVDEIVRVGTATDQETTSKVETYETDIPYTTKIEENPNLKAGTRNTKQPGVKGKKVTTVTQTLINGKAYGEATVKEEITQKPTEEIIEIGTRVDNINTSYEYQVTQPIPFETKYEDDSSLPAGEEKISQEGKDGLETITYVQELVNGKAPENSPATVKNIETTKQPVTQIIKKGTGVVDKTVTEKTESISFKTQYVDDPNLPAGEDIVIREGEVGSKTITTTQPTLNGENYGEASVVENITKAPIDKIVRRGTATAENITNDIKTFTEEIPYQTVEKNNSNLPDGVREISQEGKNGKKVTTITQQIVNGKPYGEAKTDVKITEAQDEIIQVGTGGQIENVTTKETLSIEYKTEFIDDPSLPAGEEIEIRQGINGEKTITTVQPSFKGNNYGEATVTEEITTPAQNRIVRRGTATADQITTDTKTFEEAIAYETESRENPYLPKGTQNIIQEGKNGKKTITIAQKLVNGKAYGKANVTESRDEEPISQIIEIGTAYVEESIEETPYTTKIIYDETKPVGYREVEKPGVKGRRKVITITPGPQATNPTPLITYETLEESTEEVIRIGTANLVSQIYDVDEVAIGYKTEYRDNPYLPEGEERVIQEGKNGTKVIGYVQKLENGYPVGEKIKLDEIEKEAPQTRIIERGTATVKESIEEIPYTTKIIYDENKPAGYREIETPGVNGRRKVITITPGPEAGNPTPLVTYETLEEAIEEVVVIGTKKPDSQPPKETVIEIRYEDIDFKIDYIEDPNRYVGDDKLIQKGQKGKRKVTTTTVTVDGKSTENTNIEDIEKVIDEKWLVGTKKIDPEIQPELPELNYEELPIEVEYIFDDSLDEGEEVVIQEGQSAVYAIDENGEQILPALREGKVRIIKKGRKKPQEEIKYYNEAIKTKYIDIELLPVGEEVLVSEGQVGRYYINDNGEKIYDIQPMDRVIIRGIGKKDDGENNKPINPPTNNNKPNYPIYPPSDDEQITPPSKPNEDSKPIPDTNDSSNIDLNPDKNQMDIDPAYVDELIDILNNPFRNWKNDDNSSINPIDKTPSENVDAGNKDISDVDANPNKHRKTNESEVDEHDVNPERLRPTKPSKEDSEIVEARVKSSQAIKNDNPKTGIDGSLEILALLAAASGGYFASKKKESEKE